MRIYDLEKIRRNSVPVADNLISIRAEYSDFSRRKTEYRLENNTVEELKRHAEKAFLVVFSAEWCPDCARNIPVLGLIAESTGLEVRVFGHLKRNHLNPKKRWRIPPSPPEVREFNVVRIPLITVLNNRGEKIGEIVENPPEGLSFEEALLQILKTI